MRAGWRVDALSFGSFQKLIWNGSSRSMRDFPPDVAGYGNGEAPEDHRKNALYICATTTWKLCDGGAAGAGAN